MAIEKNPQAIEIMGDELINTLEHITQDWNKLGKENTERFKAIIGNTYEHWLHRLEAFREQKKREQIEKRDQKDKDAKRHP